MSLWKFLPQHNPWYKMTGLQDKKQGCLGKLLRGDKSYLVERSMRVYQNEPTHSKIFIEVVALIITNKIYTCLKDMMKELHKRRTIRRFRRHLKEFDKIKIICQADGLYRLDYAVTATQKDILQSFNLTAASVNKEASMLGRQLTEYRG